MVSAALAALFALPDLLRYWLQIRAARERFNLQQEIETYVEKIQDEDAKLRASGSDADIARADLLRDRALAASGIILSLPVPVSAIDVTPKGGTDHSDTAGAVHPAGG